MRVFRCDICLKLVDKEHLSVLRYPFFLVDGRQDICDKCGKEFQNGLLDALVKAVELRGKLEIRAFKKFIRKNSKAGVS